MLHHSFTADLADQHRAELRSAACAQCRVAIATACRSLTNWLRGLVAHARAARPAPQPSC